MSTQAQKPSEPLPCFKVSAAIIWRESKFLASKRTKSQELRDLWEFPGGKSQGQETPKQTLIRECAEELAITVQSAKLWQSLNFSYPKYRVQLYFFHVESYLGEPAPKEEQVLRWLSPAEALALPFVPADETILHQLNALRLLV